MADYDKSRFAWANSGGRRNRRRAARHMLRVYNYMLIGLALTGATAWLTAETAFGELFYRVNPATHAMGLTLLGMIALFAPLGLVLFMSFRIDRMSVGAAQATFWAYAGLVGIGLAPILLVYTGASVRAGVLHHGGDLWRHEPVGLHDKADLSGFGSFLFMGLIGVVIASVVNLFLHSAMMTFIISIIGVLVFTGLTAYDTQSIKESYVASDDGTVAGRKAIFGALRLYLDFINLFVMLMQLLGNRR